MRIVESERRNVEKGDNPKAKTILHKLGRFTEYTTPAMKELLSYGDGKMRNGASPT